MKNKKTFLITGGNGFIGRNIANLLVKKKYKVIVYDNEFRNSVKELNNKKIKFIKGDIRDKKKLDIALKLSDAVIHLAYINGTKYFYKIPEQILDVAIKGNINIFDGCKKYNIQELYLASSSEVYQTPINVPTKETEPLKIPDIFNPRYSYGGGKILTELMGINYGKKFFKKLVIFRPHNVYGPYMGEEHVIPEFIKKVKNLRKGILKIQGSGKESRSFIYIDDFVEAFYLLITKGKHLNIYNIGSTESIKIFDLAKTILKLFNKKAKIKKTAIKKGGTKIRLPDISKIKKIGFLQKYNLDKGLKKVINY